MEDETVVKLFATHAKHHLSKALEDRLVTKILVKTVAELSVRTKEVAKALQKDPVYMKCRPIHAIRALDHAVAIYAVMDPAVCTQMESPTLTLFFR